MQFLVSIIKAGGHQEQSFVRDEIVNADVMRCLQYALTMPTCHKLARRAGEGDRRYIAHALHSRTLQWVHRGGDSDPL